MIYTEPSDSYTLCFIAGIFFICWIATMAYDWWRIHEASHQDDSDYPQDFYNVR